ncbi:hypothetical protein F4810DRAFT_708558 [Camillea tinctor]|nr:hypothetical protein F4810DRAFT_708558 [Camillea tinctor]
MSTHKDDKTAADFTSADDFKADALPMLIKSLQQGTSMFSAADQQRIVDARKRRAENEDEDDDAKEKEEEEKIKDAKE